MSERPKVTFLGVRVELCDCASLAPDDFAYVYQDGQTVRAAAHEGLQRYWMRHNRRPPVLLMTTEEYVEMARL